MLRELAIKSLKFVIAFVENNEGKYDEFKGGLESLLCRLEKEDEEER